MYPLLYVYVGVELLQNFGRQIQNKVLTDGEKLLVPASRTHDLTARMVVIRQVSPVALRPVSASSIDGWGKRTFSVTLSA
jgi:hypothetical protein